MEMEKTIRQAEENIRQALLDYRRYTRKTCVLDDVSGAFINNLAWDSSYTKQELRELFSKSPVWDGQLNALVINGTRTHDTDYNKVRDLAYQILYPVLKSSCPPVTMELLQKAVEFFASPLDAGAQEAGVGAIGRLAPKAYAPGKKPSRIFKSLCTGLGIADEAAGSNFQRLYAQFADELSSKKIDFKLFVSINPAHFLTMSNPKEDRRGSMLTSCHSFNSVDYDYNIGCAGYARDGVSFIAFTVSDPEVPELLNNRKTTRQVFAYKPGNGLLLQSRMYNSSGGTTGEQSDSQLYRDLVQREISMLEGAPNLWKTYPYCGGHEGCVDTSLGFGGYTDWIYQEFNGKVSIRTDHLHDYKPLVVGAPGLCISCGREASERLYCEICDGNYLCDECGERCADTLPAHDASGNVIYVCESCFDAYYTHCDNCGGSYPKDQMSMTGYGDQVCNKCLEGYSGCDECGDPYHEDDLYSVKSTTGCDAYVCNACRDDYYSRCAECGTYHPDTLTNRTRTKFGSWIAICNECFENYIECPKCGEWIKAGQQDACPACGAAAGAPLEVPA